MLPLFFGELIVMFPTTNYCYFGNYNLPIDKAEIVIIGIPHYPTAPIKPFIKSTVLIRSYSYEIEDKSAMLDVFYSEIPCKDIGDIYSVDMEALSLDIESSVYRIVNKLNKKVLLIGGEHLFTYYAVKASRPETLLIIDAHYDVKEIDRNSRYTHSTFIRGLLEEDIVKNIIYYGVRAYSKEEEEYVLANSKNFIIIEDINKIPPLREPIYVSIDLDVYNPSLMRLVSTPEVGGITPEDMFQLLVKLSKYKIMGGDVMEFTPYAIDIGSTMLAVKTIFELLSLLWVTK